MITTGYTYHASMDESASAELDPYTDSVSIALSTYAGDLQFSVKFEALDGLLTVLNKAYDDLIEHLDPAVKETEPDFVFNVPDYVNRDEFEALLRKELRKAQAGKRLA